MACDHPNVTCPNPGCINASGSCGESHDTPGCSDIYCCGYVCEFLPHCCTDAWDEECAAHGNCPEPLHTAPCCLTDGTCELLGIVSCEREGGSFRQGQFCGGDTNGNGLDDLCPCENEPVPATSARALAVAVVVLLLASAAVLLWRRRFASRG